MPLADPELEEELARLRAGAKPSRSPKSAEKAAEVEGDEDDDEEGDEDDEDKEGGAAMVTKLRADLDSLERQLQEMKSARDTDQTLLESLRTQNSALEEALAGIGEKAASAEMVEGLQAHLESKTTDLNDAHGKIDEFHKTGIDQLPQAVQDDLRKQKAKMVSTSVI